MTIQEYIDSVSRRYASGITTEHSFRGDLQSLIESLVPDVMATNEPTRIGCGAPDYVLTRRNVPVAYVEAKDIDTDLTGKTFKEQHDRYREALDNLAFTDYLEFRFFESGNQSGPPLRIAEIQGGRIVPITENFDVFATRLRSFCSRSTVTIKGSQRLAEMMADKAKILAYTIRKALQSDEQSDGNTELRQQMAAFRQILIHDLDARQFADVYAQTIVYGMFAARLHDRDLDTFSRQEAAELIPRTNPFLRKLFHHIAGPDLDRRIDWIVNDLADLFRATDIKSVLKNYGKTRASEDPIMHFYETFLAEYDPKLRKARGVYYTPGPVVDFIVRAVDDILKTEFGLPAGLADTSKVKVKVKTPVVKSKSKGTEYIDEEKEFHRVQILDPATGTGTFLAQVIEQIYKRFENQKGAWPTYVENDLIPRLNGFELLMASYAMAHLKLDLLLSELSELQSSEVPKSGNFATSQHRNSATRFQIYLTNALEEHHPDTGTLWASWLSAEANEANHIKRDTPVMVVIGNPPYSGESRNKGDWIMSLMEDYKKEPGGKEKLKERNPKWINDDYVKFIRLAQYFVEKNATGVLAFVNNHSFLDNPTFRGMRWNLLKIFDKIYVIDLHGNSKKKESAPDGSPDENVFDIMQGVSINILVKSSKKSNEELASVFHADIFGRRKDKYQFLTDKTLTTVDFQQIETVPTNYFMVPKDFSAKTTYDNGFSLTDLFILNNVGVVTGRDRVLISEDRFDLLKKVGDNYDIQPDETCIEEIAYRPFDGRLIYYDPNLVERPRENLVWHFLQADNVGLTLCKQFKTGDQYVHAFISDRFIESCYVSNRTSEITSIFPLYEYFYEDEAQQTLANEVSWLPNFNMEIVDKIAAGLGATFVAEVEEKRSGGVEENETFAPIDLLDYIYAVLHSPSYRERYKEFLKIDFPRVPYPTDREQFWQLVRLGGDLRQLHLLESSRVEEFITGYPVAGTNMVEKPMFKPHASLQKPAREQGLNTQVEGKALADARASARGDVFINRFQYFSDVPRRAWEFYIGGYQPAQKWLKDRKGRRLSYEDLQHYQKIIVALTETSRIMGDIDQLDFLSTQ